MSFKEHIRQAIRVLKVVKKPTKDELKTAAKVTSLGILIVGLIGFIFQLIVGSFLRR